jgi:hypothetical protein
VELSTQRASFQGARKPASAGRGSRRSIRGVLFVHSFEYPGALAEFQKAEQLDPGFAMAYRGATK